MYLRPDSKLVSDRNVDLVVGGPPCQPFSVIGHQRGKSDDRNGFPAFLSAVEKHQPKIAIFENVRGMLYRNRIYFESVCSELREFGYALSWNLLNAVDFGVPQNRERLIVVAHRKPWCFPVRNDNSRVTVAEALAGLTEPAE